MSIRKRHCWKALPSKIECSWTGVEITFLGDNEHFIVHIEWIDLPNLCRLLIEALAEIRGFCSARIRALAEHLKEPNE